MKLRTLVFSGCGTRIIGHTGFLRCIEQNFDLSQVTNFTQYGSMVKRISAAITTIISFYRLIG